MSEFIGSNIKKRRQELGMSAEVIAERIGCSPATIYRYENGQINNIGIEKLIPIAKVLRTTPESLMGWSLTDNDSHSQEQRLIEIFRLLNEQGRRSLLVQAEMHFQFSDYVDGEKLDSEE